MTVVDVSDTETLLREFLSIYETLECIPTTYGQDFNLTTMYNTIYFIGMLYQQMSPRPREPSWMKPSEGSVPSIVLQGFKLDTS